MPNLPLIGHSDKFADFPHRGDGVYRTAWSLCGLTGRNSNQRGL